MTPVRRKRSRSKVGPLGVLAMLLVISGALRFIGGPAQAIAKELTDIGAATAGLADPPQCEAPPDIAAVISVLDERQSTLEKREASVASRAEELGDAEQRLADQLERLKDAEEKLRGTLALADTAAESDIARLTAVYENMKPKEAARLFETMAPSFAAGFLARMRPDAAAKVVGGLSSDAAYAISVILAGRHSNVPEE